MQIYVFLKYIGVHCVHKTKSFGVPWNLLHRNYYIIQQCHFVKA